MYPRIPVALLAHEARREALIDFALDHRVELRPFALLAPRALAGPLARRLALPVQALEDACGADDPWSSPAAALEIPAVICFRDPAAPIPDEAFARVLALCDTQEILLATNPATAAALLYFLGTSPDRGVIAARSWGRVLAPHAIEPSARSLITSDLQAP